MPQAARWLSLSRDCEALPPLIEVERRLKRLVSFERANHADIFDWAARTLAELRS